MVETSKTTRRAALGLVGTGVVLTTADTFGFSVARGDRGVSLDTTTDPEALVGLLVNDLVKKNQQEQLVTVTNTLNEGLEVTVSLSDCGQGTLVGPDGSTGCTVGFELRPSGTDGDSKTVDITSDADGETVPFTITATSSSLSFDATRSTNVASGNTEGAVAITNVKKFEANDNDDNWTIREVEAVSNDENYELERVEYEVRTSDGNGEVVGGLEENASGNEYSRIGSNQNPAIVIEPDDGHTLEKNMQYELTVTAYDSGGNFDSVTKSDKA